MQKISHKKSRYILHLGRVQPGILRPESLNEIKQQKEKEEKAKVIHQEAADAGADGDGFQRHNVELNSRPSQQYQINNRSLLN